MGRILDRILRRNRDKTPVERFVPKQIIIEHRAVRRARLAVEIFKRFCDSTGARTNHWDTDLDEYLPTVCRGDSNRRSGYKPDERHLEILIRLLQETGFRIQEAIEECEDVVALAEKIEAALKQARKRKLLPDDELVEDEAQILADAKEVVNKLQNAKTILREELGPTDFNGLVNVSYHRPANVELGKKTKEIMHRIWNLLNQAYMGTGKMVLASEKLEKKLEPRIKAARARRRQQRSRGHRAAA